MRTQRCALSITIAALLVLVFCAAVQQAAAPGQRLHEFVFHRSFVQFVTLFFFALCLVLLAQRLLGHLQSRDQLAVIIKGPAGGAAKSWTITRQLTLVRDALMAKGAVAAHRAARQSAEDHKEDLRGAYEAINFLVYTLPACGLFGTVLGLSDSLYRAFSGDAGNDALPLFVRALGTALDTTILGLACSMIAGGLAWLFERLERVHAAETAQYIRHVFSLHEPAPGVQDRSREEDGASAIPEVESQPLHAELRILAREILLEARSHFDELMRTAERHYRDGVERVMAETCSRQNAREEALVSRVADSVSERIGRSIDRVAKLIEQQNGSARRESASQLRRIEAAIQKRVPHEVVIRYDHLPPKETEVRDVLN